MMTVAEFVVAGGDYMGVWEETPKRWNWKSFSKMTVPIALRRIGSYEDMIASIIKAESLGDNSNESFSDHSMNIHDDPTNMENQPADAEDPEPKCCEEMQGEQELGSQSNHYFSDGTNLCINQTFSNKDELQVAKKSFNFATVKSCTKYLKNKCPAAAVVLEYDIDFEKWSRARFPSNKYDVMTTNIAESLNVMLIDKKEYPVASIFNLIAKRFGELFRERYAYILKSMDNQMVPSVEKIARKKMIEGDFLYVENLNANGYQFIMFGVSVTAYVNLLEKSCSCREYDLINMPCAHAMATLRSKHGNEYGMSIYE
ncbi:hypothetical protein H5410_031004 [Solanum commersonii]|uniref:SWIM-type domain-containing protein n=1 Tax=Solanum commersonii TaxID=4109 RepID=A0A9J5YH61_SOLCO|nr:hypothetical protein H5410_031004 [Solanum commersonii]